MNNAPEKIRLVLADDHALLRKGIEHTFSLETDFSLLASVSDGLELISAVKEFRPHVVITDLRMVHMDGPEACLKIQQESPETNIIVYSMYDSEELVIRMRSLGVKGYLLKNNDASEICKAVRTVHNGGEYYCASIRTRTRQFFQSGKMGAGNGEKKQEFNETELQIINLICSEYSTKEIANKLKIKERTIQSHKEGIEEKMNVRGVVGIAVYAMSNWLLY